MKKKKKLSGFVLEVQQMHLKWHRIISDGNLDTGSLKHWGSGNTHRRDGRKKQI